MNATIFLYIIVIMDKSNLNDVAVVVGGGNGANFLPLFLNGGRRSDGASERASCGNLLARVTLELFRRKLGAKNQPTELQGMGHPHTESEGGLY